MPIGVFTGLKPKLFSARPIPLKSSPSGSRSKRKELIAQIIRLYESMRRCTRDSRQKNPKVRRRVQKLLTAHTGINHVNFHKGAYALIWSNRSRKHTPSPERVGPMWIIKTKSDLVLVVEDLFQTKEQTGHAQRLISYLAEQS